MPLKQGNVKWRVVQVLGFPLSSTTLHLTARHLTSSQGGVCVAPAIINKIIQKKRMTDEEAGCPRAVLSSSKVALGLECSVWHSYSQMWLHWPCFCSHGQMTAKPWKITPILWGNEKITWGICNNWQLHLLFTLFQDICLIFYLATSVNQLLIKKSEQGPDLWFHVVTGQSLQANTWKEVTCYPRGNLDSPEHQRIGTVFLAVGRTYGDRP